MRPTTKPVAKPIAKPAAGTQRPAGPPHTEGVELTTSAAAPASTEPGLYSVSSEPDYATIFVDGNQLGDTPLFNIKLAPGKHTVRAVRSTDQRERTFSIEITAGTRTSSGNLAW